MTVRAPLAVHRDKTEGICGAVPPAARIEEAIAFGMAKSGEPIRCQSDPDNHLPALEHHHGAVGCWYEKVSEWPPPSNQVAGPTALVPTVRVATPGESLLNLAARLLRVVAAGGEQLAQRGELPPDLLMTMADAGTGLVRLAELEAERRSRPADSA